MTRRDFVKGLGLAGLAALVPLRLRAFFGRCLPAEPSGVARYWIGVSGRWDDPANWRPYGVPESGDDVIISAGSLTVPDEPITLRSLTIAGGTVGFPLSAVSFNQEL